MSYRRWGSSEHLKEEPWSAQRGISPTAKARREIEENETPEQGDRVMVNVILSLAFLGVCAQTHESTTASTPDVGSKLAAGLSGVINSSSPDDLIPVAIVLQAQVSAGDLQQASQIADKRLRRAAVVKMLQALASETQGELLTILRAAKPSGDAADIRPLWIHNVVAARLTPKLLIEVARRADIARISADGPPPIDDPLRASGPECAPASGVECGVAQMDVPLVWNELGFTGSGVVIGIIDTGVCIAHLDLADHLWVNPGEVAGDGIDNDNNGYIDDIHGWNFRDDNDDLSDDFGPQGHGTFVSGAALGDGTSGMQTGVAPDAQLMVLKGSGIGLALSQSSIWAAIQYGVAEEADVLNLSSGFIFNPPGEPEFTLDRATWRAIYENAIQAGVVCTVAAGNQGGGQLPDPPEEVLTPGDVPGVITVGMVDCADGFVAESSQGPVTWEDVAPYNDWPYPPGLVKPDVTSGGSGTTSLCLEPCSDYRVADGTSYAAPHVAGVAALMLEANPNLIPEQIKQYLMNTAFDLGDPGLDNIYGAGRVDAYEAVLATLPVSACCFSGGGCSELAEIVCLNAGGSWHDGEPCLSISTYPIDQSVFEDYPVTFSVVAEGVAPLTYQWRFDGVDIAGATQSSYTIASATPADAGLYDVVVDDTCGQVTSNAATLTVYANGDFTLLWHSVDGGGETLHSGGDFELGGTSAQHDAGLHSGGPFTLTGGFWSLQVCAPLGDCPADLNGDGWVDSADLAILLGSWGLCKCCPADFNRDGIVDGADLALLLGSWGQCP